jgi:hypothetical protein
MLYPENEEDEVIDISIIHPGDKIVKFGSDNFAIIPITEVNG